MKSLNHALDEAQWVEAGDACAIAKCSNVFHEVVVPASSNDPTITLMGTISGRIT